MFNTFVYITVLRFPRKFFMNNFCCCFYRFQYEPQHDKTNKVTCAPREDSYQPGQPPSLIRVFAVRIKKAWVLSYLLSAQRRLITLGGYPGWSESSLGARLFVGFVTGRLITFLYWYISVVLLIYLPGSITSYFVYGKDVQSNVLFTMSAGPIRTLATILMT